MNKKALILLAMAATLAIPTSANAVSNITGVTNGGSGTFNISADFVGKNGGQGFKKYTDFTVGSGDTANLLFDGYTKNGTPASITTFINLVQNKVNINGIVNSMKGSSFYNGHVVFITPGGMVVGSTGVLNVGRLSTVTPNGTQYDNMANKFQALLDEQTQSNADAFVATGVLNFLSNSKTGASWGSNGDISVDGKIFAREGVVLRGRNVSVDGSIVNGLPTTYNAAYTSALFDSLVNTANIKALAPVNNASQVVIESSNGMQVLGNVLNNASGTNAGVYITNNGDAGMEVSGNVYARGYGRLYNTKGDLNVHTGAKLEAAEVQVLNNGGDALTLSNGSTITAARAKVYNHGSDALTTAGTITTTESLSIKNEAGKNASNVGLNAGGIINSTGDVAIRNYDGAMNYTANLTNGTGNVGIVNQGTAMTIGGTITNSNGIVNIKNEGTGLLKVTGTITNTSGSGQNGQPAQNETKNTTTYITNKTGSGFEFDGTVNNKNGDLALNNYKGNMTVNGTIKMTADSGKKANLGIVDRTGAGSMTVASDITNNAGNTVIKKESGTTGNMTVNGTLNFGNAGKGYMAILNNAGDLNLGATVVNNGGGLKDGSGNLAGGFYAITRGNGTGVNVTSTFNGTGNGEYLIKNKTGANGLKYQAGATIDTKGSGYQAALVNRKGDMNVAGNITADRIIVRAGTQADPSTGKFTVTGTVKPTNKDGSYIVNWYSGSANAVNNDPENGKMYKANGSDIEIRQEEVR